MVRSMEVKYQKIRLRGIGSNPPRGAVCIYDILTSINSAIKLPTNPNGITIFVNSRSSDDIRLFIVH